MSSFLKIVVIKIAFSFINLLKIGKVFEIPDRAVEIPDRAAEIPDRALKFLIEQSEIPDSTTQIPDES